MPGDTGLTFTDIADADADVAAFNIDKATGQITVAQELDFESRALRTMGNTSWS